MPRATVLRLTAIPALCLTINFLIGCAEVPVVSGDLSCQLFRRISAGDQAVAVMKQNRDAFRPLAEQIASHNEVYTKHCEEPAKGEGR